MRFNAINLATGASKIITASSERAAFHKATWDLGGGDIELEPLNERGNRGGAVRNVRDLPGPKLTERRRGLPLTLPPKQEALAGWETFSVWMGLEEWAEAYMMRPDHLVLGDLTVERRNALGVTARVTFEVNTQRIEEGEILEWLERHANGRVQSTFVKLKAGDQR